MAPAPKAKSRLFDLRTQAVGIVGRAANQRTFLVRKNEAGVPEEMTPEAKADPPVVDPSAAAAVTAPGAAAPVVEAGAPLSMTSATKTALSTLLSTMLDSMSTIASAVEASTVDEAAPVPADLLMQLDVLADGLDEGIDSLVPSDELAPELLPGEDAATQKAAKPALPVSRSRKLLAQKRLKAMTELHKSINDGHAMIGKGMSGLAKMMGELSGKTPPAGKADGKEPVVEAEKTEKSAQLDIVALFSAFRLDLLDEVKKSVAGVVAPVTARLAAVGLRAPAPLPRAALVEGNGAPPRKESLDWDSMVEEARKNKTG